MSTTVELGTTVENEESLKETTKYISLETSEDLIKRKNFFYISAVFGFVWIIFHFTAIFFFGMMLQSVIMVGIFLGIGNLVALILDIPIGVLQKYFKPKSLIITSQILMLIAGGIFLKFIYAVSLIHQDTDTQSLIVKGIESIFNIFLNDGLNIVLLLASAVIYGAAKEINDVTNLSYIMNNSDPSEYAEILSTNGLFVGAGSLIGLILSGIILAINPSFAVIVLMMLIIGLIFFTSAFFNNGNSTIQMGDIKDLKITMEKGKIITMKNYAIEKIKKADLVKVAKESKIIFIKPINLRKSINFGEIFATTKIEFLNTIEILSSKPVNIALMWCIVILGFFGFWDTFVATFQIQFLDKILQDSIAGGDIVLRYTKEIISAYVLLGVMVLPAFVTQIFFIRLSSKAGVASIVTLGILLSGISISALGIVDNIWLVILFGIINSLGYAAVMPLIQDAFCASYNKDYAKKLELTEIDSNASAAPLRIVSNFINILGLVFGGLLVGILGFNGFFMIFGICLILLLAFSIFIMKYLEF